MAPSKPLWPTVEEYDIAMQFRAYTLHDEDIKLGTLDTDNLGILRFKGAHLYVCLYKVDNWIVRCFCSSPSQIPPPSDIMIRYEQFARFCHENKRKVSALIDTFYIDQGIDVPIRENDKIIEQRTLPIIKMPFINAPSLGDFVKDHYKEKNLMEALSEAWFRMIYELENAQMAHGDLDLTNVLVKQEGSKLTLKLIDYDNIWIPMLAGRRQTEHGHKSFQHPAYWLPNERPYNAEMDRFSALVMYISLQALITYPYLYEDLGADDEDRLLLSADDFQKEADFGKSQDPNMADNRIQQLYNIGITNINPYLQELKASLHEDRMPFKLDSIVTTIATVATMPPIYNWEEAEDLLPRIPSEHQYIVPMHGDPLEKAEDLPLSIQSAQSSIPIFLWEEAEDLPPRIQPLQPEPLPIYQREPLIDNTAANAPTEKAPLMLNSATFSQPLEVFRYSSGEAKPSPTNTFDEQHQFMKEGLEQEDRASTAPNKNMTSIIFFVILFLVIVVGIVLLLLWLTSHPTTPRSALLLIHIFQINNYFLL